MSLNLEPIQSDHSTTSSDNGLTPSRSDYSPELWEPRATTGDDLTFIESFNHLHVDEGWTKKKKRERLYDAVDAEFEARFGTILSKLEVWQEICKIVGVSHIPDSIRQCQKVKSPYGPFAFESCS